MKKLTLVLGIIIVCTSLAFAEYYKVNVRRVEQNLYKVTNVNPAIYIETKYCYEYSYGEDAVLMYDQYSYSNKLVFDNGTSCDVSRVF